MKRVFSHIKRLFRKFWFFLIPMLGISPIAGLCILIIATVLSLALFSDPVETKDPADFFTEDELRIMQSDEEMNDEEFLVILAKYQSYLCPVKVDKITTWTSSEVTKESFICNYEINDRWHRYGEIDMDVVKKNILAQMDKDAYKVERILATNRNMIFRYWNCQTKEFEDVVLSGDELRSL